MKLNNIAQMLPILEQRYQMLLDVASKTSDLLVRLDGQSEDIIYNLSDILKATASDIKDVWTALSPLS